MPKRLVVWLGGGIVSVSSSHDVFLDWSLVQLDLDADNPPALFLEDIPALAADPYEVCPSVLCRIADYDVAGEPRLAFVRRAEWQVPVGYGFREHLLS